MLEENVSNENALSNCTGLCLLSTSMVFIEVDCVAFIQRDFSHFLFFANFHPNKKKLNNWQNFNSMNFFSSFSFFKTFLCFARVGKLLNCYHITITKKCTHYHQHSSWTLGNDTNQIHISLLYLPTCLFFMFFKCFIIIVALIARGLCLLS